MDFRELFLTQHARAHTSEVGHPDFSMQDIILHKLTDEHLRARPNPSLNSMAWLLWHMTRGEDIGINLVIAQKPQVLDEEVWGTRLKVTLRDAATGMSDREVDAFSQMVDIAGLLAYRAKVGRQTQTVVRDLQSAVLDEKISSDLVQRIRDAGAFGPNTEWVLQCWLGKAKGFTLMHTVLGHTHYHLGQCVDDRTLLGFHTI